MNSIKDTRIVFMGTPDFAVPVLRMLVEEGYNIVQVVTQPDRPKGRKRELTPPPVKEAAQDLGLPVYQPEKIRISEEMKPIINLKPDLIITAAFGQILPKALLDVPTHGCINVHASLLPKYRGGAPIHQSIIDGEEATGVTIMYMVEALDAGDMIAQSSVPIMQEDHVGTMFEKLSVVGANLLKETLPALLCGEIQAVPQDARQVTFAPTIKREQEILDWNRTALQLYNQVRGMHPWPVAFTLWNGQPMKIWWAEPLMDEKSDQTPGSVVALQKDGIVVATGDGCLKLTDLQPSGKKRLTATQLINGRQIHVGDRLGE
ncbi:methionyl-tRNA formyltransferase [Thermoactinomyces sp. DSM 45892]|uniref:methionyl-tRNA formyltransferase n=1 Tax=Thermoactinomyces sp. DSM 45892 TaxID=1882753 RepID=UPI000899B778|nr:methionyl-tRNA formyltransferase [Thermoactinomyces sp. DSM 45892]SDY57745.1 methionyl-tRNA formyltransferase [Thermoactinomyces sp. DSM 45892]